MKINIATDSLRVKKKDLTLDEMNKIVNYKRGVTIEEYPSYYKITGPQADLYRFLYSMAIDFDIDLM